MNEIKLGSRYKLAIKRAMAGEMSGRDLMAIVEYQLREYVGEDEEPFNAMELVLLTNRMVVFN